MAWPNSPAECGDPWPQLLSKGCLSFRAQCASRGPHHCHQVKRTTETPTSPVPLWTWTDRWTMHMLAWVLVFWGPRDRTPTLLMRQSSAWVTCYIVDVEPWSPGVRSPGPIGKISAAVTLTAPGCQLSAPGPCTPHTDSGSQPAQHSLPRPSSIVPETATNILSSYHHALSASPPAPHGHCSEEQAPSTTPAPSV